MPDLEPPYFCFTRRFELLGCPYAIGGGVAAIVYGESRLTLDVDLLLHLQRGQIDRLIELFPAEEFYVPPPEVLAVEIARGSRGHFNLVYFETGFRADVYLRSGDPLDAWTLGHVNRVQQQGEMFSVAPPEAVIIRKLEYFREGGSDKHVRDIRTILDVYGNLAHRDQMGKWIVERGLSREWDIVIERAR